MFLLIALVASTGSGCTDEDALPVLHDGVEVLLWTTQCEPDIEPEDHFFVNREPYSIRWEALCVRDRGDISWWALKVSLWEDRAEDAWNVWLIDPAVTEATYGDARIDAIVDPNIPNVDHPLVWERTAPAPLTAGDYRVEVWGIVDDYLDSMRNEVRLTVVSD